MQLAATTGGIPAVPGDDSPGSAAAPPGAIERESRGAARGRHHSMSVDEHLAYLTKGCVDVVRAAELKAKLERFAKGGPPLVVKVGFDPTAPDLHLGHTVLI